jgi:hypothetical protein
MAKGSISSKKRKRTKTGGTRLPPGVLAKLRRLLATDPNVVGFSGTLRDEAVRGKLTGRKVIRIYTEKRMSPRQRAASRIPARMGGVPVELMEIGKPESADSPAAHRGRYRPLIGGISAISANLGGAAGTLGYFVEDAAPPPPGKKAQWYILSCAHVLNSAPTGIETLQPAGGDGGKNPNDFVGKLTAYTYANVDAAIAKIDTGATAEILGLAGPYGTAKPRVGLKVTKSGRTTGVTVGEIVDDSFVVRINYASQGVIRNYASCLLIQSTQNSGVFMDGGDSGSLVMDDGSKVAVGMIVSQAVSPRGAHRGIAHPIISVMRAFPDKRLVGNGTSWP